MISDIEENEIFQRMRDEIEELKDEIETLKEENESLEKEIFDEFNSHLVAFQRLCNEVMSYYPDNTDKLLEKIIYAPTAYDLPTTKLELV